ncbi:MAG: hypothetical protein DRI71_03650 [Bacteroidetes bacterium]|nr:MAG: hypothetical protein DRI71_03650 [Bacteroidota bacterium]
MRIRLNLIALTLILGVVVSSCKEDPPPAKTDEQLQTEKLAKAWVLNTGSNVVTLDGNDVSLDWTTFELTLGDKTYNSINATFPEVWPSNGTWAFDGADVNTLVRDDGVKISIAVTDTSLQLQFDYSAAGGRLAGVEGSWVFKMVPK